MRIQCGANTGAIHRRTTVLFEPDEVGQWPSGLTVLESLTTVKEGDATILPVTVSNNNKHNVNLPSRVVLERLQLVRSVTPVEVKSKEPEMVAKEDESIKRTKYARPTKKQHHQRPLTTSGLTPEQQEQARKLLYEEADTFAATDDDVDCIPGLLNNYSMSARWI